MNILSAENLTKSYGTKALFESITFGLEYSDKVGLIGVNGTGKSTLLRVLAGLEVPDTGKVTLSSGLAVEYLPQDPEFQPGTTVLEQVFRGSSPIMQLVREYEDALVGLQQDTGNHELQHKLLALSQRMDANNAWQLEAEAKSVLTKLGISDFAAKVEFLSGGMKKRIALASALITPADLLILDEPTNHLDHGTVDWLEQYLNQRKGALIIITHDRYFLDRVVNKIFELDQGKLFTYSGNYSVFLDAKLQRLEQEQATENKRQNLLRNELAWMRRGAKARTTKQKARIDRFHKLAEQKPTIRNDKVEISAGSSRLGKKVIELQEINKGFADRVVINNFSYIVGRDDRIGIIGENGCGKSTLLNLIARHIEPDSGGLAIGETVKVGYFSQENTAMDPTLKVIEYIKEEAEVLPTIDGNVITASQLLERFLFPPYQQWTPIAKLSGGEKRRLYLLRILMSAPNVLLLDEPTNDLDIQTLTILEDYLDEFPGVVIAVSHDRYFLDRMAERIFAFKNNGVITEHTGNYSDYMEFLQSLPETQAAQREQHNQAPALSATDERQLRTKDKPLKFSYREQKEYEEIDDSIATTEHELQAIKDKMNLSGSDYGLLQTLLQEQQALENKLETLIERWAYLTELAENIQRQKQG